MISLIHNFERTFSRLHAVHRSFSGLFGQDGADELVTASKHIGPSLVEKQPEDPSRFTQLISIAQSTKQGTNYVATTLKWAPGTPVSGLQPRQHVLLQPIYPHMHIKSRTYLTLLHTRKRRWCGAVIGFFSKTHTRKDELFDKG